MSRYILAERAKKKLEELGVLKLTEESFRIKSAPPGDPSSIIRIVPDPRFAETALSGRLGMLVKATEPIEESKWTKNDLRELSVSLLSAIDPRPASAPSQPEDRLFW